ncbi:hypothetical protein F0562_018456 [Nyssa sinensis]|uniref:Uncharacterized protein n=1 Tax=Nyssa sinensis TaxID=561372 RepID=A0A5J4ZC43_9ASTE|nr:hypothetical protein F0562_018456 [Nyssa sinensis]
MLPIQGESSSEENVQQENGESDEFIELEEVNEQFKQQGRNDVQQGCDHNHETKSESLISPEEALVFPDITESPPIPSELPPSTPLTEESTQNVPPQVGKAASASHNYRHSSVARSDTSCHIEPSRAPPPSSFEEETVKEVLSETPTVKPPFPKIEEEEKKNIAKLALQKIQEEDDDNVDKKSLMVSTEDISEVSEICSLSESVSTTTVTEKRKDDDGEVRQRVERSPAKSKNRSFSGDFSANRDRMVGNSLVRRSEPSKDNDGEVRQRVERSPAKSKNRSFSGDFSANRDRMVGNSPVRRSNPSPGRVRSVPGRERHGLLIEGQRRDSGGSSGLRSGSPATRTGSVTERPDLGRCPSARRSGKSPGRVRSDLPTRVGKVAETNREGKWAPATNESLENPLVSLECFIFL